MKRLLPFFLLLIIAAGCLVARGSSPGLAEALRQLIERADSGDAKSMYELARLYDTGFDSIPKDSVKSNSLYFGAALKYYPPAQNIIGFRYYSGNGFTQNIDSAYYWIEKAAIAGDITAASNLGFILSQDEENRNLEKAFYWLNKAAGAGVPSAMTQLGDLYRQGMGVEADTLKAITLYEESSEKGDPNAQYKLLAMMGYKWDELTSDSALNLGLKYYLGWAPVAGVDLFEKAASKGNIRALSLLGDAYSRGIGTAYDHAKSLEFFYKAAMAGDSPAQFIIAELLEFFPDELGDQTSQFWYEKASEAGINDSETAYRILLSVP